MREIKLKKGRDESIRRGHTWIFSGAVYEQSKGISDGDRVAVLDPDGKRIATGHYQDASIRVRLFHFGAKNPPHDWIERGLANAWALRKTVGLTSQPDRTNAFRLVHGEGDRMPGLIIDLYGDVAIIQAHSIGMHREREHIAAALLALDDLPVRAVYDKSKGTLPDRYAATVTEGFLAGDDHTPTEVEVLENGHRFQVDFSGGQKTGFFLDQRDNRALLAQYASGRSVLNTFCYTGGFSIYALAAGASRVTSVDVSARAMELVEHNRELNALPAERHESRTEDVIQLFKDHETNYDIVVVDPPAFAKSFKKRHKAVQAYKRLNAAAMQRVAPGGLLFTFSCSAVVDRELFENTIVAAGLEAGRPARIIHRLSQGADHPVNLFHTEGSYLKGLVLEIG
jgi:23S rRNA (cytosine1962-C5)-methyltransferase